MAGETDLKLLIREMQPKLNAGEYVFCTMDLQTKHPELEPVGWFREQEGLTVILSKKQADEFAIPYDFVCAWITLNVHSALEAVGLTAAVSDALTRSGISCNIIAGYYHDHLFVPIQDAERALDALRKLSRN